MKESKTETKSLEENIEQKKVQATYNSVTEKRKIENQNQTHNVRKEGRAPINQKR